MPSFIIDLSSIFGVRVERTVINLFLSFNSALVIKQPEKFSAHTAVWLGYNSADSSMFL